MYDFSFQALEILWYSTHIQENLSSCYPSIILDTVHNAVKSQDRTLPKVKDEQKTI